MILLLRYNLKDMELKAILKNFNKYKTFILVSTFVGILIGGVLGYFSEKYSAVGSFYVGRKIDSNLARFFTYEGYYGQQTALSYTKTAIGLIKSPDVKKQTLEKLNIEVTDTTLREFGSLINTKKAGPQLITVTVRGSTEEKAGKMWILLADSFLETAESLNLQTDPNLTIIKVSPLPIIKYSCLPLISLPIAGGLMFLTIGLLLTSLKEYL